MLHSKTEESCRYHKMVVEMTDVVINISTVSLGMLSVIGGSFAVPKVTSSVVQVLDIVSCSIYYIVIIWPLLRGTRCGLVS